MAVSYVYSQVEQGSTSTSTLTLTVGDSVGAAVDDLCIVQINCSVDDDLPTDTPTGWRLLEYVQDTSASAHFIYFKHLNAADIAATPTSHVWTFDSSYGRQLTFHLFRGGWISGYEDNWASAFNSAGGSTVATGSLSTSEDYVVALCSGFNFTETPSYSTESGWTLQWQGSNPQSDYHCAVYDNSSGTTDGVFDVTVATIGRRYGFQIAITPIPTDEPWVTNVYEDASGDGDTTYVVDKPAEAVAGDLMVLHFVVSASSLTFTPHTDWTTGGDGYGKAIRDDIQMQDYTYGVYVREVQSGDPSSWNFTSDATTGDWAVWTVTLFKNVAPWDCIDASGYDEVAAAESTYLVSPSATATEAGFVYHLFGTDVSSDFNTTNNGGSEAKLHHKCWITEDYLYQVHFWEMAAGAGSVGMTANYTDYGSPQDFHGVTLVILGTALPAGPTTVTAEMSGEDRYVDWSEVAGESSYVVERSVNGGGWTQVYP